ncbi:MAG: acireductone synthase [Bradymonadaceae bacterium]|nr:acireductone synthase [Lujinxingiaceae bacterium]
MASPTQELPYAAVVLDIEGTTTPVSFVYEVLFPFARAHLASFLEEHWQSEGVQSDVAAIREDAERDVADQVAGARPLALSEDPAVVRRSVVENVLWQMDNDRKTTGLKALQGRIWQHGYARGELEAIVYEDVARALAAWSAAKVPVFIYSSGSVAAQMLLFAHTDYGDLSGCLSGYFDTTTGPKRESASYRTIAQVSGHNPGDVVFVTDVFEEARAAREAGMQAWLIVRAGNAPLPEGHGIALITSLEALL